jgi:hypothetical protein
MSRHEYFTLSRGGVEVEILSCQIKHRLGAGSGATFDLPAEALDAIGLDLDDDYTVTGVHEAPDGSVVRTALLVGAVARDATYDAEFRAPEAGGPGEVRTARRLSLQERLWAYADAAPGQTITHKDTDVQQELQFLAGELGVASAQSSTPNVKIPRIDYTRQSGFWSPLNGYVSPWDPTFATDPASGEIRIYDTSALHALMPRSTRVLTGADWVKLDSPTVTLRPRETQYAVSYFSTGGDEGPSPVLVPRAVNRQETRNADGSRTITWDQEGDIFDDPDNPTVPTRTIEMGQGQTVIGRDNRMRSRVISTIQYRADYTLTYETTTTTEALVTLPGAGEVTREVERLTETRTYQDHPTIPRQKILKTVTKTTRGVYVFIWTGAPDEAGDDGHIDNIDVVASGAQLKELSWNRGVETSASSSLRTREGVMSIYTETTNRNAGVNSLNVAYTDYDALRECVRDSGSRTEQADNAASPNGYTRIEYVPTTATAGRNKTAKAINAGLIGRELGLDIARRRLARSGTAIYEVSLTLARADWARYRLGWVVTLGDDTPYGLAGRYLCVAVDLTLSPVDARKPVEQRLTLRREW